MCFHLHKRMRKGSLNVRYEQVKSAQQKKKKKTKFQYSYGLLTVALRQP